MIVLTIVGLFFVLFLSEEKSLANDTENKMMEIVKLEATIENENNNNTTEYTVKSPSEDADELKICECKITPVIFQNNEESKDTGEKQNVETTNVTDEIVDDIIIDDDVGNDETEQIDTIVEEEQEVQTTTTTTVIDNNENNDVTTQISSVAITTTNTNNVAQNEQTPQVTEQYVSGGFPLWNYSWHSGLYLGRLRIPSVGVDVAIYNDDLQSTIDAVDSAMFVYEFDIHDVSEPLGGTIYCGDHNVQGFNAIANCTIGCEMYIDGVDGNTYKYICDRIDYNGINTRQGLKDSNGNTLDYSGGVWCYTCHNDSDYYIYEVHFVPV